MKSARLKIERANKHIEELGELLEASPPFILTVVTDTKEAQRRLSPEPIEENLNRVKLVIGDIVHALRSALDHAYCEIVEHKVADDKLRKKLQFPFCSSEDRLSSELKVRQAQSVSTDFVSFLTNLRPFGGPAGDQLLFLIHDLDIADKHHSLVAPSNLHRVDSHEILPLIPDFPPYLVDNWCAGNGSSVSWPLSKSERMNLWMRDFSLHERYTTHIHDIPVTPAFLLYPDDASDPLFQLKNIPISALEAVSRMSAQVETIVQKLGEFRA